jgi:pimeloyl-ACP methyl ester carboxylesterase
VPNASLAVVPDAGHALHLERPEVAAAMVRDFLA